MCQWPFDYVQEQMVGDANHPENGDSYDDNIAQRDCGIERSEHAPGPYLGTSRERGGRNEDDS